MEASSYSPETLRQLFAAKIRAFDLLTDDQRHEVLRVAQDQLSRQMPFPFVLSSARSLARDMAAREEEEAHPPDREVQAFIEANALPPEERVSARQQPRREARLREREELALHVRDLLREARSARQPHERKRMRRKLMGIDQARIQRVLGREGQELARQIQEALLQSTDLR